MWCVCVCVCVCACVCGGEGVSDLLCEHGSNIRHSRKSETVHSGEERNPSLLASSKQGKQQHDGGQLRTTMK